MITEIKERLVVVSEGSSYKATVRDGVIIYIDRLEIRPDLPEVKIYIGFLAEVIEAVNQTAPSLRQH